MKIKDTIQALLVFTLFVLSVLCMVRWVIDSAYDRGFND